MSKLTKLNKLYSVEEKVKNEIKEEQGKIGHYFFELISKYKLETWNEKNLKNAFKFLSDSGENEFANKDK